MKIEHHPNGFTKFTFVGPLGYRVRLHYWPKGHEKSLSRHNHRWWFISVPLWGRFVDDRYDEVPDSRTLRIRVSDRDDTRDSARAYALYGTSGLRLKATLTRYPFVVCHEHGTTC
jgi:hypothetical protein